MPTPPPRKVWPMHRKKKTSKRKCLWRNSDSGLSKDFKAVLCRVKELRVTMIKEVKEGMMIISQQM